MRVPEDTREEVFQKINDLWTAAKECPVCTESKWALDDRIFQLVEYHEGKLLAPGVVKPLIAITCSNCGYTFTMNAILLGIIEPDKLKGEGQNE